YVRRASNVNLKILFALFMHDLLDLLDWLFRVSVFEKGDDIAGLPIFRHEQPAPKRTRQRIGRTFWSGGETLDASNFIDRLNLLGQMLQSTQVALRSDVAGRNGQDELRLRRKTLLDLFRLLNSGIAG